MPEVLEVLKQAETVIANLLSYRYASSPPTDLEFRQARRTLSALRASCESSALPAASDGMPPLPRSSLMMFPCRTVCFVAADMHTYAAQRNAALEARLAMMRKALEEFAQSRSATSDAARLDWLQKRGATVSMVPGKGSDWQFQIGGLYGATDTNIRIAIDAAIAAGGSQ